MKLLRIILAKFLFDLIIHLMESSCEEISIFSRYSSALDVLINFSSKWILILKDHRLSLSAITLIDVIFHITLDFKLYNAPVSILTFLLS